MSSPDPLGLALDALGYSGSAGLVEADTAEEVGARDFVWREMRSKCGIDAAHFVGGVPLVAFVRGDTSTAVQKVRSRLWNLSRVPLLIATTSNQVAAFSCFAPPPFHPNDQTARLKASSLDEMQTVMSEFSRFHVEAGSVTRAYADQFGRESRVDRRLLHNLRQLRESLGGDAAKRRTLDSLIGRSIFVRFLEDRGILSSQNLRELIPFDSYSQILDAGFAATVAFFTEMSDRFNGDIFAPSALLATAIEDSDLAAIADFFRGSEVVTGQQALWPYNFAVIPPELISSIYEQLLEENQQRDAAFYTPRKVVDLMLDEVLPWRSPSVPRILDPACGSGSFLTEAFRRLVYRKSVSEGPQSYSDLVALLTSTMFGVDQNEEAVNVAAFGLYLSLLEEVDPPTAWTEARLPNLVNNNLFVSDFFEAHPLRDREFDIVIGNPPWQNALSQAAKQYLRDENLPTADNQIAIAFLWKAQRVLARGGALALLLPAKGLLHNKSPRAKRLRGRIFRELAVETVVDLSALRRDLFISAVEPAAILIVGAGKVGDSSRNGILHVVPRSSPMQSGIEGFVLCQGDVHVIDAELAASSGDIWKTYLWGSDEDYSLVAQLRSQFRKLETVLLERGWISGQGFTIGKRDKHDSSHLLGLPLVFAKDIFPLRAAPTGRVIDSEMHRPRDPRLFRGPHILLRYGLGQGLPSAAFLDDDAAFENGVLGIAAPIADREHLRIVAGLLNSSLSHYYQFMTSSSWGVERDKVELGEYLSLPVPEIRSGWTEPLLKAVDIAEAGAPEDTWRPLLDKAVYDAYSLGVNEIGLVQDALTVRLDIFRKRGKSRAFGPPSNLLLADYLEDFHSLLQRSLPSFNMQAWHSESSETYMVLTTSFAEMGKPLPGRGPRRMLERLLQNPPDRDWPSPTSVLQLTIVVVDGVEVHLVKPNELRFWTQVCAKSDAGTVLASLSGIRSSEYSNSFNG